MGHRPAEPVPGDPDPAGGGAARRLRRDEVRVPRDPHRRRPDLAQRASDLPAGGARPGLLRRHHLHAPVARVPRRADAARARDGPQPAAGATSRSRTRPTSRRPTRPGSSSGASCPTGPGSRRCPRRAAAGRSSAWSRRWATTRPSSSGRSSTRTGGPGVRWEARDRLLAPRDLRLAQGAGSRPARRRQLGLRDPADAELPRPDGHRRLPPLLPRPGQRGPVAELDRGLRESPGMALEPARGRAAAGRRAPGPVRVRRLGAAAGRPACSPTAGASRGGSRPAAATTCPPACGGGSPPTGWTGSGRPLDDLAEATQCHQYEGLQYEIGQLRRHGSIQGYVITELTDLYWEANGLLDIQRGPKAYHDRLAALNAPDVVVADIRSRDLCSLEPLEARVTCLGIRRRSAARRPRGLAPRDRGDRHGRGGARRSIRGPSRTRARSARSWPTSVTSRRPPRRAWSSGCSTRPAPCGAGTTSAWPSCRRGSDGPRRRSTSPCTTRSASCGVDRRVRALGHRVVPAEDAELLVRPGS